MSYSSVSSVSINFMYSYITLRGQIQKSFLVINNCVVLKLLFYVAGMLKTLNNVSLLKVLLP
jgi:hypothetical protein